MRTKIAAISTIALVVLITMMLIPMGNAHVPPYNIDTWAFLAVEPSPVGINQPVFVSMWIDKVPPGATGPWGPRWHGFMVGITKPDGSKASLGPYNSDSVGGAWLQYTPDQLGTYQFVFSFPGQTVANENPSPYPALAGQAYIGDIYTASTSKVVTLIVQQAQIVAQYGAASLPTEYWTRPINSMNREWASIGGNWLGIRATSFGNTGMYSNTGNFMPYSTAPNSAHVVWTKPIAFGGQIGGEFGSEDLALYATGTAYEAKFGAVIINGILYYTEVPGAATNRGDLKAVDMRTGEDIWTLPMRGEYDTLRVGMVYNFITGDQYGAHAYLFTSSTDQLGFYTNTKEAPRWSMYEAMTGEWILDIANQSAGTLSTGPNGEILSYSTSGNKLTMWNASKCIQEGSWGQVFRIYTPLEIWRPPQNATIDWNKGIEWSKPLDTVYSVTTISEDVVLLSASLGGAFGVPGGSHTGWRQDVGYNAKTGALLWGPINRTLTPWTADVLGAAGEGVYVEYTRQTLQMNAYNIQTGVKMWTSAPEDNVWGYYDYAHGQVVAYGNVYSWGLGGSVYCYDVKTGGRKWSWSPGKAGFDTPYGVWPLGTWGNHHILADGKLYVRSGHDYTPPVWKGAELYCIDAYTGTEIWRSLSFDIVGSPALHDGYMLWLNGYDNQIYCYSKGPSAIDVSASPKVSVQGSSVLIEGMVTDESPGTKETLLTARFPNGVPAISDEDQSNWMEYLYQQQPKPTDAVGVQVHLTAVDPNGNTQDIGNATSDAMGLYKIMWTPPVPGAYTIVATFAGSDSYYSSSAETALGVSETSAAPSTSPSQTAIPTPTITVAPTATASPSPAPQPEAGPSTDMYVIAAAAAVIIAAVAAAAVFLRKRK